MKITNWDGKQYSLEELIEMCNQADECEMSFSELIDGDAATSSHIIRQLALALQNYN